MIFHVELSPKVVASAFWRGEVENELRRIGMVDYKFNLDNDYEKCISFNTPKCVLYKENLTAIL